MLNNLNNNPKEDIARFVKEMGDKYGYLPKWNYSFQKNKLFYNTPFVDDNELVSVINTFLMGKWAGAGQEVKLFEDEFAAINNNKHCVAVNSGSSANLLMLAAIKELYKFEDNDEILVSVVGFSTTFSAIILNNLKPVFIDIENKTLNFNLELIEQKITNRTKAILVSPVLANPPDYDKLKEICEKHNLLLITDGCDSLLTKWNNQHLNELSIATSCSFYAAHHATTMHGGSVTTDNEELSSIIRSLSRWGSQCKCRGTQNLTLTGSCGKRFSNWLDTRPDLIVDDKYVYNYSGYNTQMLDIQAAMGREQLKKLEIIHKLRNKHKQIIENLFRKYIPEIYHPIILDKASPSWFGVPLVCPDGMKVKLVQYLENNGIQTRNYFCGNSLCQKAFQKYGNWLEYDAANKILENVFFIGCNPNFNQDNFDYLESIIKSFQP